MDDIDYDVYDYKGSIKIGLNVKANRSISKIVDHIWNKKKERKIELCIVIANLLANKDKTFYYSRKDTVKRKTDKTQYNKRGIGCYGLMIAIDLLEEQEFIINNIAERQFNIEDRIPSTFYATPKLFEVFGSTANIEASKKSVIEDEEYVVLKQLKPVSRNNKTVEEYVMVDYADTAESIQSRAMLKYYYSYIDTKDVKYTNHRGVITKAQCRLNRIHNNDLDSTGRLYHSSIVTMHTPCRETITIDGEMTTEVDYCGLHLAMLVDKYQLREDLQDVLQSCGLPTDGDVYLIPLTAEERTQDNRDTIKTAFNIVLNCKTKLAACRGVQHHLKTKYFDKGLTPHFRSGTVVVEKILEAFHFFPDSMWWQNKPLSHTLQKMDSDIALELICLGAENNIPVLPVHDSFLTISSQEAWLKLMMKQLYCKYVGNVPSINVTVQRGKEIRKETVY